MKACGKFPSASPVRRSPPRRGRGGSRTSASSRRRASPRRPRPARASASTYQNVQMEKVPSSPSRPSGRPRRRSGRRGCPRRGSSTWRRASRPARIGRSDELHERHHEHARVEHLRPIVLDERLALLAPALVHDLVVDAVADTLPAHDVARQPAIQRDADGALDGHHDMSREYVKCWRPPRTSQMPSSA